MSSIKEYTISKNIGLYDPNGLYNNPLTNKPYQNLYENELNSENQPKTYINLAKIWSSKLVYDNKEVILESIAQNQITLAKAGTGVGKTILIPRIAMHAFDYKENVICTIPKKLTTKITSEFVAQCMDVKIGEHVGYFYQGGHELNKNGIETKLTFTTTGSLVSRITGSDPLLSNYKCVIVDEVHERSIETDLLLLLLKKVLKKRKDLKVIIMSATVNLEIFRNYFPSPSFKFGEIDCGTQTSYKITPRWDGRPRDWKQRTIELIMLLLKKTVNGDIMVFIKSKGDGNQLCDSLNREMNNFRKQFIKKTRKSSRTQSRKSRNQTRTNTRNSRTQSRTQTRKNSQTKSIPPEYEINPYCAVLDGKTQKKQQTLAVDENAYKLIKDKEGNGYPYTRKIVFTTNVAESSITVEGIKFVIESGLEYTASYEPTMRVSRLLESNIAQSAVKQRKGRVGRTSPGMCIHLYSENDFERFEEFPTPSIEKQDITMNILDLLKMSDINTIKQLRLFLDEFISPPHEKFIINALNTLYALGAITDINNNGKITPMGLALSKFRSLDPNFARSLIASHFYGCSRSVCDIIALSITAEGRIDSILSKFYPDKKKSKEWNNKELAKHKKIMKSFEHHYGDYMSILKAYKMYLSVAVKIKDDKIKEDKAQQNKINNIITESQINNKIREINPNIEFTLDDDDENEYDVKSSPSLNKWCKEHYISPRKMAKVRKLSGELYRTLQSTLNPYQSKKPYKELSKADKQSLSIIEVNEVLDSVEPIPESKTNIDSSSSSSSLSSSSSIIEKEIKEQEGGFIRQMYKEEELQKLEPNVKRFDTEDDNIMMSLGIGNFINLAKLKKGTKDIYESCFAEKKKLSKINIDSFIKVNPQIIMYHQLFMTNENNKFLKLNMVNKIPNNVWEKIKKDYGKFIKYCL
jgi:HrpA-like RNA helicase